ncbi:hypothetical protein MUO15_16825 [Halobacillus amylolyticus]|uniref:Uncharacterized protein n=1 Tax=Halobacillus amylolyticus TaxID=2932259 RepID=A0ABY4H8P2_9BACI|nr:hypothetical protein [Halobacillus amylolyticus]UOR11243.1 hypothetical protein MUO15_16825 [Halobacillus amylolyticus]
MLAVEIQEDSCGNSDQSEIPQERNVSDVRGGSLVARGKAYFNCVFITTSFSKKCLKSLYFLNFFAI